MSSQQTYFGSLENYQKGGVEVIDDDPKHYAFSNVFEVASKSKPYEKVAVGKNLKYVIEAVRAEGTSPWFAAAHDEAALVMDGEIEVHYLKPTQALVPEGKEGSVKLASEPAGGMRALDDGLEPRLEDRDAPFPKTLDLGLVDLLVRWQLARFRHSGLAGGLALGERVVLDPVFGHQTRRQVGDAAAAVVAAGIPGHGLS